MSDEPETFLVPWSPTAAMWGGLARVIMTWLDCDCPKTPRNLLTHLKHTTPDAPDWLLAETEMQHLDHTLSKGTRCVLIYRAMLADSRQSNATPKEHGGLNG